MTIDSEIKQPYKKTEIKKAFDFTLKTITNISAPFLLLIILKDLHETVAYMKDNFLIALTFLIVFTFLFIWNVIILSRQTKIKSQKSEKDKSLFSIFPGIILRKLKILPRFNFRKFMLIVGIIISVGSLILFGVLVHLVNSTDAHYVVIASEPNEKKAVDRIQDLDEIIKEKGIINLKARAYASGGGNPYYMITINRSHFTKESAEKTLNIAKSKFGKIIPSDAYIYSTSRVSFFRRILSLLPW